MIFEQKGLYLIKKKSMSY